MNATTLDIEHVVEPKTSSLIARRTGPRINRSTQQLRVLQILRSAGSLGVNREKFLTPVPAGGYGISQVASRLFELRKMNVRVDSRKAHCHDLFITYYFISAPENIEELIAAYKPRPAPKQRKFRDDAGDWRANVKHAPSGLPLFDSVLRP